MNFTFTQIEISSSTQVHDKFPYAFGFLLCNTLVGLMSVDTALFSWTKYFSNFLEYRKTIFLHILWDFLAMHVYVSHPQVICLTFLTLLLSVWSDSSMITLKVRKRGVIIKGVFWVFLQDKFSDVSTILTLGKGFEKKSVHIMCSLAWDF